MLTWTPELDRTLLSAVNHNEGESWGVIGRAVSEATGLVITKDMARNRYNRLQELETLAQISPVISPDPIEIPAQPINEYVGLNIAFYDLETTSLGGWTGDMLCAAITDNWGRTREANLWDFPQRTPYDDAGLAAWVRDNLEEFDILCAWNGFMFDQPFLNAKLVESGQRIMRDIMGIDPMYKARPGRYGLKVGSSKLKSVAQWLRTPNQKPELPPIVWRDAVHGDREAMALLQDRCKADTLVMRDNFQHLKPMIRTIHR